MKRRRYKEDLFIFQSKLTLICATQTKDKRGLLEATWIIENNTAKVSLIIKLTVFLIETRYPYVARQVLIFNGMCKKYRTTGNIRQQNMIKKIVWSST